MWYGFESLFDLYFSSGSCRQFQVWKRDLKFSKIPSRFGVWGSVIRVPWWWLAEHGITATLDTKTQKKCNQMLMTTGHVSDMKRQEWPPTSNTQANINKASRHEFLMTIFFLFFLGPVLQWIHVQPAITTDLWSRTTKPQNGLRF